MSDGYRELIEVLEDGTESSWFYGAGYSLIAIELPALDLTAVEFEVRDAEGNGLAVEDADGAVDLGAADTGEKVAVVPEALGRLAAVAHVRLTVATQTEPRQITLYWQRR